MTGLMENASQGGETAIICCNTLEDEPKRLMEEAGMANPVIWVEAGMHNQPEKLRDHLKATLKDLQAGRVLMALGHCGGATVGLQTGDYELIIPKTDDCLSLLMGSMARRLAAGREAPTYFLTGGWLRYTENLISSFTADAEKFGRPRAERIYKIMLKHYKRFGLITTGAYDLAKEEEKITPLAQALDIKVERLPGDLGWLRRLLSGPWPETEFLKIPPHNLLTAAHWQWLEAPSPQL